MKTRPDLRVSKPVATHFAIGKIISGSAVVFLASLSNSYADVWKIAPEVTLTETFTDNAALVPASSAQNSWVTEVTPSLHIEHLGSRVSVLLDYRLRSTYYLNQTRLNSSQNFLNAASTFEAVENWLYVDARSSITQQNRSAFDSVQLQNTSLGSNRVETNTYQISPYIRGRFADAAIYQLRLTGTETRTNDAAFPDTKKIGRAHV